MELRESLKEARAQTINETTLCLETSRVLEVSAEFVFGDCALLRLLEKGDAVAEKCFSRVDLCCGVIMH